MEYRVLGSLEVREADGPLPLGGEKQRVLLALLLLNANRVVSRDRLIDELWGENLPKTAVQSLQVYVSRLRKLLPEGVLQTRPPGYLLQVEPDALDLGRFESLRASGRFEEALALWRGPALAEFEEPFARLEGARLEDLRLATLEDRIDADLALGRHAELIGELETLIAQHPHRERLRRQLMLALYRSERQTEALAAYRDARAALDELGIEPSERLRMLERQILHHDPTLDLAPQRLLAGEKAPLPGPLVPESPFPFVGREVELGTLRELMTRAVHGEGGVVLLTGEPGAGKSRLVREFAQEAVGQGALVLYGVSDAAVSTPYQPLREWVEFLVSVCEPEALRASLGDEGARLSRLVPNLEALGAAAEANPAEADRYLLQSAAAILLRRLSRAQPILLVIDDLHWADTESLELLRLLARTAPEIRVLMVAAYRDPGEEVTPHLAEALAHLVRLDAVSRLTLGGLAAEEVGAFVRASTDADASPELTSAISELTDGTPLLVCELWRDLDSSGAVEVRAGTVRLARPVAELHGPERINEAVRHRLSRLATETNRMLEFAAAAGPRFELRVVADAADLDSTALAEAVAQSSRHGIVEELPEPTLTCRFTHELIRRAIYDPIHRVRLPELHLRVGEALERVYTADPERVLPELAHHYTLAAPVAGAERGVAYNLRAAEAAAAAAAHGAAAERLSAALELGIGDPRERVRIQIALARAVRQTGRNAEAAALFSDAHVAATKLGERVLAARALVGSADLRLNTDPDVGPAEIVPIAEEAVRTLREFDDELGLAQAERLLGMALYRDGREQAAVASFERAVVHAEAVGDRHLRRVAVRSLAEPYWSGAMPVDDAIVRLEQLRATSRDDSLLEAIVGCCLGYTLAMAGRFDEARAHIEASAPIVGAADEFVTSPVLWLIPQIKELAGDDAGAEQDWIAMWTELRTEGGQYRSWGLRVAAALALLYVDQGRWDEACGCLSYGEERSDDLPYGKVYPPTRGKVYSFLRHVAQARVAAHLGDTTTALELARRAVDSVEHTHNKSIKPRVLLEAAEVERAAGHTAEADAAVAKALELYEEKGNVAAVARLRATGGVETADR
jgi:DNA-binding SARP family transcriptional activator